jgi:hypothetical protein
LSTLIGVAACLAIPGCLGELPEAEQCPSPAAVQGKAVDCLDVARAAILDGSYVLDPANLCLIEDAFNSCYRGSAGCSCNAGECLEADDSNACFPRDDCPPRIRELYPEAECKQLSADDIGPQLTEADQCLCGCESCIQVCDGRGPVWTQVETIDAMNMSTDPGGLLLFDVRRHMPSRGKLGLYVRARGFAFDLRNSEQKAANAPVSPPFVSIAPAEGGGTEIWETLPQELDDRFEEVVLPRNVEPYSWDNDDERPGLLVLSAGWNTATMMEIDCIVPFVIPD